MNAQTKSMQTAYISLVLIVLLVPSTGNTQSNTVHQKDAATSNSGSFNLQDNERNLIIQALSASNNSTADAAKKLGISEHALLRKMKEYKINSNASTRKPRDSSSDPKVLEGSDRSRLPIVSALIDMKIRPTSDSGYVFDCVSYRLDRSAMSDEFPPARRCVCSINDYDEGRFVFTPGPIPTALSSSTTHITCYNHSGRIPITAAMIEAVFPPFKVLKYKVMENGVESAWIMR